MEFDTVQESEAEGAIMKFFFRRSVSTVRNWMVLAVLLYASYGVMDIYYVPHHRHIAWIVRIVVVAFAVLVFIATFFRRSKDYLANLMIGFLMIGILGLNIIIASTTPDELAYHYYFVGYILALVWTGMLGLRPLQLCVVQVIVILSYNVTAIYFQDLLTVSPMVFYGNNSFLITILTFSSISSKILESFISEDYRKNKLIHVERNMLSKAQKELLESNLLKDKLLSIISHDVRGPLSSIKGTLGAYTNDIIDSNELKHHVKKLIISVDSVLDLLNTLMQWSFSRSENFPVEKKYINLRQIVIETFDLVCPFADLKKIALENNVNSSQEVYVDATMLSLILRNLITNAVKFTERGSINIYSREADNFIEIFVEDSGMGIKADVAEKLLSGKAVTSLGTSREIGLGLGLTMCREFIEMLGGSLTFFSTEGKGTIFKFTVPEYDEKATQQLKMAALR